MKKIVLMHYHLKTGGVSTVLKQQIEALKDECKILLFTGQQPQSSFPAEIVHIPELNYFDGSSEQNFNSAEVAESIFNAIKSGFNGQCDLIHVHNPLLAKNVKFLSILRHLQKKKLKLLLQVHDFAEDGRPLSLYQQDKYLADCHYGVINSRDYEILLKSGLKKEGLHLIPNIVNLFEPVHSEANIENIALYPVRAIRRKNIGEAILLSLFFKHNETLAITLPPASPQDIKSYADWKAFTKENELNIQFEAGINKNFSKLVNSSRFILTTSISEGFGFSFLEPWLSKKIVWGRKLPGICYDFEKQNINLGHMYTKLLVPISWIGKKKLYQRFKSAMLKNMDLYKNKAYNNQIKKLLDQIIQTDQIDFGLLDEVFQKKIILSVLLNQKNSEKLLQLNPKIALPGDLPDKQQLLENNFKAVKKRYNLAAYKKNLLRIYSAVINNDVEQSIDQELLLKNFLNPEELSLLKWSGYVE